MAALAGKQRKAPLENCSARVDTERSLSRVRRYNLAYTACCRNLVHASKGETQGEGSHPLGLVKAATERVCSQFLYYFEICNGYIYGTFGQVF
jgi:hypothetical protein